MLLSGAVLGLTDVDALTISMARGRAGEGPIQAAAQVICIGVLSNTVFKLAIAVISGGPRFRRYAAGSLALMALATAVSLVSLRDPIGQVIK